MDTLETGMLVLGKTEAKSVVNMDTSGPEISVEKMPIVLIERIVDSTDSRLEIRKSVASFEVTSRADEASSKPVDGIVELFSVPFRDSGQLDKSGRNETILDGRSDPGEVRMSAKFCVSGRDMDVECERSEPSEISESHNAVADRLNSSGSVVIEPVDRTSKPDSISGVSPREEKPEAWVNSRLSRFSVLPTKLVTSGMFDDIKTSDRVCACTPSADGTSEGTSVSKPSSAVAELSMMSCSDAAASETLVVKNTSDDWSSCDPAIDVATFGKENSC